MLSILLTSFFPFNFPSDQDCLIEIVLELLPRKNEVENACHTQSRWLMVLFFATIIFFMLLFVRECIIYVVSQEAMTSGILLCCIARTQATSHRDMQTVNRLKQRQ
jgi:hypothetical protein